ncbi:MAG: phosphoribosylglycinamide formyltransferase [Candidatus Omnitrophica bacterium]|nr:phosphoribosylglycinamide formyltransferase [Candidatus Omnitrophota bacterium]
MGAFMNFAVLASGHGGNLQAIINAVKKKKIKAHLKLVVSDRADAYALVRARKANISSVSINPQDFPDREAFDRKVLEHFKNFDIDFVVLAGYMRLLGRRFIKQYPHKILNIHPALLPAFKGVRAIREALAYGVKVTGVSVHFVVEEMDSGAIIMQQAVPISSRDTAKSLATKIHRVEHKIYPQAIDWLARRKLRVVGRRVFLR